MRKLKLEEIKSAASLAYSLSLNPSTNSYHLRNSQEEFSKSFNRAMEDPEDELLGYFTEDELIAVLYLSVETKNLYLQISALFIKDQFDTVMSKILEYLDVNYSGFDIHIGFPKENETAINYLLNNDYKMVDSLTDQRLKREDFIPTDLSNAIVKVSQDNYVEFAKYHDSKSGEIYWKSNRIKEHIDHWILYSYCKESKVKATIAAKKVKSMVEIFALLIDEDIVSKGIEEDLITAALNEGLKDPNIEDVLFFIDSDNKDAEAYSKKLGFSVYSHYRCLYKKL